MKSLIEHLENKVIINDLLIKKMKYEVQLLFRESTKQVQAKALANKINNQLDTALIGLKESEKDELRQALIKNSFMVVPNPISENINYKHVFTNLTNYDATTEKTYLRLTRWLNLNTELDVTSKTIESYVTNYKIDQDDTLYKRLHLKSNKIQIQPPPEPRQSLLKQFWFILPLMIIVAVLSLGKIIIPSNKEVPINIFVDNNIKSEDDDFIPEAEIQLPPTYEYEQLNYIKIFNYLDSIKDSTLTSGSYLTTINTLAKSYNTDPLLLIAIIGHEQNFVPKSHADADEMILNPYNVYGSWLTFRNSFEESTTICLNTIETAKNTLPEDANLVQHLNITYAEDPNWHQGVQKIYDKLKKLK